MKVKDYFKREPQPDDKLYQFWLFDEFTKLVKWLNENQPKEIINISYIMGTYYLIYVLY